MTLEIITTILKQLVDVSLVWLVFYYILKNIKNNVRMVLLFKGIAIIIILKILSDFLGLITIGLILEYIITWGPIAIIVIFQPEIRGVLEQLGRSQLLGRHKVLTVDEREKLIYEVTEAMEGLKSQQMGALIVLERDVSLRDYIDKAKKIYADLSNELLISIFFHNNPLHDGGVILQGDKITCAGAVFPVSKNNEINKRLGTRHRAALGITENTDAISLIVSEETGRFSVATKGVLHYNLSLEEIKIFLFDELKPKTADLYEEILKEDGDKDE